MQAARSEFKQQLSAGGARLRGIVRFQLGSRAWTAIVCLMFLASASPASARDVTVEQSAVQFAQQEFDRADAAHKADLEQLAHTRKALQALQKQFDAEQKKANQSGKAMQQAKAKLVLFPDGPAKEALCELADYVVSRRK